MMITLIWTAVLIAVLGIYFRKSYSRFSDYGVKNPKTYPFFGNMARILFRLDNITQDLDRYYKIFPEERFVGKYEFIRPVVFVKDLDLVKRITIKDFEHFLDHRSFISESVEPLFARNLVSLKGQEWKDMRSTLSPAFTSSKIKLMVPFMEEVGEQMIRALKKQINDSSSQLFHEDKNSTSNDHNGRDAGFATVEESAVGKKNIDRVWSDIDLVAQAMLFFIAGFETISTEMSFALHEMAVHPDIQDQLYKEIKENHIKNGGKLNYSAIQNMTYLDMVVSEVLRMWPPGPALDRLCVKDYNLGRPNDKATTDYIIRKGEVVSIPAWCFHHSPEYFPDPEKFDPTRFSDENKHLINPMAYMPFGLGPRNCIGSRFALCELKVLLYQILLHIEVSPSAETRLPARIAAGSLNLRLEGGHRLTFKLRD